MPRRNRPNRPKGTRGGKAPDPRDRPIHLGAPQWTETRRDGQWVVRSLRGGDKSYVCPGCNQQIPTGTAHFVVWREDSILAAEARRHWHTPCWNRAGRAGRAGPSGPAGRGR